MLKNEIDNIAEEVISLRRDFHKHPELGNCEVRTSGIVEEYLRAQGIETHRIGRTGLLGIIKGERPGKVTLLRADMDALPIKEMTGVEYASENEGVMHACGHDAHTSMLLCAAKIIQAHRAELAGTVKLMFQPNEEGADGAASMVRGGVLKDPDVNESYAIHVHSAVPAGSIGISAGPAMAERYNFKIKLHGKGGHSSSPQEALDPILCASHIVDAVQMIQSREINVLTPTSIVFGRIQAGTQANIIPETAELEGTLRYMYDGSDDSVEQPRKRFQRIVEGVCNTHRLGCDIEFTLCSHTVINDADCVERLKTEVFPKLNGSPSVVPFVWTGSDDFSEFSNVHAIPGVYMILGIADHEKGTDYPQHSPMYNIVEEAMPTGVEIFVRTVLPDIQ